MAGKLDRSVALDLQSRLEGPRHALGHAATNGRERGRRLASECRRVLGDSGPQIRRWNDEIDEADVQRFLRGDQAPFVEEAERPRSAKQPRECLRAANGGMKPMFTSGCPSLASWATNRTSQ